MSEPFPSPGDLPSPGFKPRSPALQADSLLAEPQEKPKNTGVFSLSLLKQIFLFQELNHSLLHHRQFLYQLNYQGSPVSVEADGKCLCCSIIGNALGKYQFIVDSGILLFVEIQAGAVS